MIHSTHEQLLKNLLEQVDRSSESESEKRASTAEDHPSDETLSMFCDGLLTEPEQTKVIDHLAECVPCRKLVSQVLIAGEVDEVSARPGEGSLRRWRSILLAVAAIIIVGMTVQLLVPTGNSQLAESDFYQKAMKLLYGADFAGVHDLLADARQKGVESGRLTSLEIQATRGIPDPIALSSDGRLSEFGYGIGGVVAMGAVDDGIDLKSADQRLQQAGGESVEVLLNRGHVLLTMGDSEQARDVFDQAISRASNNAHAWLGRGIARYMQNDFSGAAEDFRETLQRNPELVSARINLAMTLEELDELNAAIEQWEGLLNEPLPATEKEQIQRNLQELQQASDQ